MVSRRQYTRKMKEEKKVSKLVIEKGKVAGDNAKLHGLVVVHR